MISTTEKIFVSNVVRQGDQVIVLAHVQSIEVLGERSTEWVQKTGCGVTIGGYADGDLTGRSVVRFTLGAGHHVDIYCADSHAGEELLLLVEPWLGAQVGRFDIPSFTTRVIGRGDA